MANRELGATLTAAVAELPATQRTAFLLHHVNGCSLQETADVLGCRLGTVKSHIFRATGTLRRQLSPWVAQERQS